MKQRIKFLLVTGPGQVVKLSTSRRVAALLRAAGHRGWCVFGQNCIKIVSHCDVFWILLKQFSRFWIENKTLKLKYCLKFQNYKTQSFFSAGCSRVRYGGAVASLSQLQISTDLTIINLKSKTILWTGW